MQTRYLQRGDLFERPASKAAVVCFDLGWDEMWFMRMGNATAVFFFGGACLLMGRARACGVDRRLARFLFGHSLTLNDRRDTS